MCTYKTSKNKHIIFFSKRGADIATDTLNSTSKIDDIIKIVDDPINYADDITNSLDNISEIAGSKSGVIEGGVETLSKADSKVLRQNLINAGETVPDFGNAAHHIVAGNSAKSAEARAILQKYGVDINDATNGVFLPTVKDVAESAYHPSLHTNAYYDEVNRLKQIYKQ